VNVLHIDMISVIYITVSKRFCNYI